MAVFAEAVKGKMFKCDECKKLFSGEDVVLSPAPANISMELAASTFLFVDKDGVIKGGIKGPNGSLGDQVAHCPLCNFPHLFGFDTV
jgi:hypothetical protein